MTARRLNTDGKGKYIGVSREYFLRDRASVLKEVDLPEAVLRQALERDNADACDPPLDQDTLTTIMAEALASPPGDADGEREQSTLLVELAESHGAEFFHSASGSSYITMVEEGVTKTFSVKEKLYRDLLAFKFYRKYRKVPNSGAIADAVNVLAGRGMHEGPELVVNTRVAGDKHSCYIDVGDDRRTVLRVDRHGWGIVDGGPVRFRRPRGLQSLPMPVETDGSYIRELRIFLNVRNDHDFILIVCWLISTFQPQGPYPVLVLQGEQGSAKSTTARLLRLLVDPNAAPIRSYPHEERDLMIAALNAWVVIFDNLSRIPPWLADALCRLSTGGGFAKRENYSDMDEILIDAQRPIILNGIEELATRGDLMDRAIVLDLPRLSGTDRQTEAELMRDFEAVRPRLLGALLAGVSAAIRGLDEVVLSETPRMADFARWASAAEPAFGWQPGAFMEAYRRNRSAASETVIDAAPISRHIRTLVDKSDWHGTAEALLQQLERMSSDTERRHFGWPKGALSLANMLRRLRPAFAAAGIEVEHRREGKAGTRMIHIRVADEPST